MMQSDLGNFAGSCPCDVDWDTPDIYDRNLRKARKEHRCIECNGIIRVNERYEHVKSLFDGHWYTYHTCMPCANIARSLGCRQHYGLGEQFFEMFGWNYLDDPADWDDDE